MIGRVRRKNGINEDCRQPEMVNVHGIRPDNKTWGGSTGLVLYRMEGSYTLGTKPKVEINNVIILSLSSQDFISMVSCLI